MDGWTTLLFAYIPCYAPIAIVVALRDGDVLVFGCSFVRVLIGHWSDWRSSALMLAP